MVDISKLPIIKDEKTSIRFWEKVDVKSDDECWIWKNCKNPKGFGVFILNKSPLYAHRIAYEAVTGKLQKHAKLLHICNNNSCCNPKHVFLVNNIDFIMSKVDKKGEDDCWNWTGSKTSRGYGVIGVGSSELFYVHRLVYESIHEKIPNNMVICHHCDNPSCVNPKHLFIGTQNDNIIDMRKKGRAYSKLTRENVEKIREMHKLGFSTKKLSEEFKISGDQIRNVVNYKQWR